MMKTVWLTCIIDNSDALDIVTKLLQRNLDLVLSTILIMESEMNRVKLQEKPQELIDLEERKVKIEKALSKIKNESQ